MVSFGFHILLSDENAVKKYREYHKHVWPEVELALEKIGVSKMRIFYVEPLSLFMYIEAKDGFNPEKDWEQAEEMNPKVKEWCTIMNHQLLQRQNSQEDILAWKLMEDIYRLTVIEV